MKNLLSMSAVGAKIDYGVRGHAHSEKLFWRILWAAFWRVNFSLDKAFEIFKTGPSYSKA